MAFERKNYRKLKHDFGTGQPHPLTNGDLHKDIISWMNDYVPEYQEISEMLDYSLPHDETWQVLYEDMVEAIVNTGSSEGIYIDVYLCQKEKHRKVMVFKTLDDSMDAYIKMGMLSGILTAAIENYQYQNEENLLTWNE